MRYALVIFESETDFAKRGGPEAPAYWEAWSAYTRSVQEAGVMVGGAGLQPPTTATVARIADGETQIEDGPFLDSKEQLGGFYLIEVPDLDAALQWASRIPISDAGAVEVRPLLPPPPPENS